MSHPKGPVADAFADRIRRLEDASLSELAVRSYASAGRASPEPDECTLRTPFQRDRDRIVHTKAFRRLKHKTQVFIAPEGDHFRTRMTHTLEVSGISRGVARALRLNEDLAEAIALGHDLGHPPFGHTGEEALDRCLRALGSEFRHNEHSLRVVDVLERDGRGLNLTAEVRDGILHHTGPGRPQTLEGRIVRLVDRFAYVNHDIDDAVRAGILGASDLPAAPLSLLGDTSSRRIDALVHDLVETSDRAGDIEQSQAYGDALAALRRFMFQHVYLGTDAQAENARAGEMVEALFRHHLTGSDPVQATDWVAGMTDRYALRAHSALASAA
ncbi:MAG TPA: deoxyguanosinetriphosphate triphosphohydrolase [Gaiellales bacterium]|nr:deoxyguanosinetriphosphate triphosphohydrolase [Gaiellales bacterium]